MNNRRPLAMSALALVSALTFTGCAGGLEGARAEAFTTLENMEHLSTPERSELLGRLESAQDETTIDRIVAEAADLEADAQDSQSEGEALLEDWIIGQRWQMVGFEEGIQRGFEQTPAEFSTDCFLEFVEDGSLVVGDTCSSAMVRADSWEFDPTVPAVSLRSSEDGELWEYYRLTPDDPEPDHISAAAERSTAVFAVSPIEE